MADAQKLPNSLKTRRLYARCPKSLTIFSTLIESNKTNHRNLIRLNKKCHRALFDRIFDYRIFHPTLYVIFKFSEIYLNGDITFSDIEKIGEKFNDGFIDFITGFSSHDIIKDKYKRYNSDDRLRKNYVELAAPALKLYLNDPQTLQLYLKDSHNNR